MHDLCPPVGDRQGRGEANRRQSLGQLLVSVHTEVVHKVWSHGHQRGRERLSSVHLGAPRGCGCGTSPATLQRTWVRRAHTSPRSSGTQAHWEGSGREAAALTGPSTCNPSSSKHGREKRDFYLFSPSSPGTSTPWPFVLRGSGSEGLTGHMGHGAGSRFTVALLGRRHRTPLGCAAGGPGAGSAARAQVPAAGRVSPGLGHRPEGCLLWPGGSAGAGRSCSSAGGSPCASPAAQVGGGQADPVFDKIQQRREKGGGPLSAQLWQLQSIHILHCSLPGREADSKCLPRFSGSQCPPLGQAGKGGRLFAALLRLSRGGGVREESSSALPGRPWMF